MTLPPRFSSRTVLVDTSAFYAFLDRADQWHHDAVEGFARLASQRRVLVTTNLVVAETYSLILSRIGEPLAQQWVRSLGSVNLLLERTEHRPRVMEFLSRFQGRRISYVDALSFAIAEEERITEAFTFDRDFLLVGLTVFPGPA